MPALFAVCHQSIRLHVPNHFFTFNCTSLTSSLLVSNHFLTCCCTASIMSVLFAGRYKLSDWLLAACDLQPESAGIAAASAQTTKSTARACGASGRQLAASLAQPGKTVFGLIGRTVRFRISDQAGIRYFWSAAQRDSSPPSSATAATLMPQTQPRCCAVTVRTR